MKLRLLPGSLSICRLPASDPVPGWVEGSGLSSITRTAGELSLVVPSDRVPPGTRAESGWRALEVEGPIPFTATGVLESLLAPLARAGVPVFAVSTFDTDYVLVGEKDLVRAIASLRAAGHQPDGEPGPTG